MKLKLNLTAVIDVDTGGYPEGFTPADILECEQDLLNEDWIDYLDTAIDFGSANEIRAVLSLMKD